MTGRLRAAALAAITVLVTGASLVSFAESYRGLYLWAHGHHLSGIWAAVWPLQVDVFIAVGELTLLVALAGRWRLRSRAGAWAVTLTGLAVSVAGNVGHLPGPAGVADRVTAAVPPLAAAAALAVGLGVLKRVIGLRAAGCGCDQVAGAERTVLELLPGYAAAEQLFADELGAGAVPGIRGIKQRMRCGYRAAKEVQDHLRSALVRAAVSGP